MVEVTTTVTARLFPTVEQSTMLTSYLIEYNNVLNHVSMEAFRLQESNFRKLHDELYYELRRTYSLGSQAVISAEKEVISRYKTVHSKFKKDQRWSTVVKFRSHTASLVYNRDYSLSIVDGEVIMSLVTLNGRIKVPVRGLDILNNPDVKAGTLKLKFRRGKWIVFVPVTREVSITDTDSVNNVVGVDLGLRHIAVSYDSKGSTKFYRGGEVKDTRAHYKLLRSQLQQKNTSSSRRRLRKIGSRESRWMNSVNHTVSKALVNSAGSHSLIVVEDLTGIRKSTEKVCKRNRYLQVSWSFYDLRQKIEYKAKLNGSQCIAVDPRYTSQTCPKCGHCEKGNRKKSVHTFICKRCGFQTNDDRIGSMNLQAKGIQYRLQSNSSIS